MKPVYSLLLSFLLFTQLHVLANNIRVSNPGAGRDIQPALQAAANRAHNGDVLIVPAGQFVLNKSVVITRMLSVQGAGIGKTILYRAANADDNLLTNSSAWDGMLHFTLTTNQPSGIVVSGITFRSKQPSLVLGDSLSLAADVGIKLEHCYNFVVHSCRFEYFGCAAVFVVHDDSIVGGLINNNQFFHNAKGPDALGLGYGVVIFGENLKWIVNPRLGSSNFIFVEDNTFDFHRHSIAAGGCALYVFRHNKVINNIAGGGDHAIDAHAARLTPGLNYYGTRAVEVYNDSVVNTTFKDGTPIIPGQRAQLLSNNAVLIKSGDAIIHDIYVQGYRFAVGIIDDQVSGVQNYPISTQSGYNSGLAYGPNHTGVADGRGDGDLFTWNNTFTPYVSQDTSSIFYNFQPEYFVAERDFHTYAKPAYATYTYPHPLASTSSHAPLGIDEPTPVVASPSNNQYALFPTPASDIIHLVTEQNDTRNVLEIFALNGTFVSSQTLTEKQTLLDVSAFAPGCYFLRITGQNGTEVHKAFITR